MPPDYMEYLLRKLDFNNRVRTVHLQKNHQLEGYADTKIYVHHYHMLPEDIAAGLSRATFNNHVTLVRYQDLP